MKFHRRCGDRVTLLNGNRTAVRNFVEFNHGLILSAEPLKDDVLFEVCIDRKVNVWNGSLEIGVTTLDPEYLELPATATKLRNTAWIMSGSSIVRDGVTLINSYGPELDSLREADCLGVMRTSKAELVFYMNGSCLGSAANDMPAKLFAVIDLYGQCVQVSIMQGNAMRPIMESNFDQIDEDPNNDDTLTELDFAGFPEVYPKVNVFTPMTSEAACALVPQDRLRFHPRCGILVKLSANNKSAERARPLDDYNNGVVMTHRPLYDNELFEIRIDRLVEKWSGSIEVGVTTHNPAIIRFPSTMTNMDSGTIMMSGCKVLFNGHGTCIEYGTFNLDELREGDTVGMLRKGTGELHYYINGVDQGVATEKVEPQVWGVVDLYGMTVKVSIVDPCEDVHSNVNDMPPYESPFPDPALCRTRPRLDEDTLLFHSLRDSNVLVINDGKTAHRPNAFEFFDNGIVMTNRPLKTNEMFQVRLDIIIPKWAGSIEIGVTQQSYNDIQLPFRMSNAISGTWALTGEDVIYDGAVIIPQYVRDLNRLTEGETVGVMRKDMGIIHFYVNGADQGPAAFNVPEDVFGVIDLYGRVAQVTIVEAYVPPIYTPDSPIFTECNASQTYPEKCFHHAHGRNARLSRNRLIASRSSVYSEFNDAVLFSSKPLRECDMFELRIDKMVDCWIGSLEIGVTAICPDDLEANGGVGAVAGTATDLIWDTYILSGAAMMKDGECIRSGYPLDLDTLTVGSRVGIMWHADRSIHYYLDGMDMGKAWYVPHLYIYAVVDLYGQCTQVTILQNEERTFNYNGYTNSDNSTPGILRALATPPPYWSFSEYCGDNVVLIHDYTVARRRMPDPTTNLVFSSAHLAVGEIFEIKILECNHGYAGTFRMGVTDINILNAHVNRRLPPSISYLPHFTAYIDGPFIKYSVAGSKEKEVCSFVPSFEWLRPGDRLGFKRTQDSRVLLYYNSELCETAFHKVPDKVYVVMELFGQATKIQAVSRAANVALLQGLQATTALTAMPAVQMENAHLNVDEELPVAIVTEVVVNEPTVVTMDNSQADGQPPAGEAPEPSAPDATSEAQAADTVEEANGSVTNQPEAECCKEAGADQAAGPADMAAVQTETNPVQSVTSVANPRRRRPFLPYTFYYIHGKNIRLCSSDTVAQRFTGYNHAVAIVSQPLRRGHSFRFRIDKITDFWLGTVSIGALGSLPTEPELPVNAIQLDPPVWVGSNEVIFANGAYSVPTQRMGEDLEAVVEQSVLTIHFRFNGELIIEIDGKIVGNVGVVARNFSHVFPLIDLYGKVQQVSILLHPHVVSGGVSLDLPVIAENPREDGLDEPEQEATQPAAPEQPQETARKSKNSRAASQFNLVLDEFDPLLAQPGPSSRPDPVTRTHIPLKNGHTGKWCKKISQGKMALHHSLILFEGSAPADNSEDGIRPVQKSHSTHSMCQAQDDAALGSGREDPMPPTSDEDFTAGQDADDVVVANQWPCDTNIRHNDRYPEANDGDSLDNEIIDGLTLETGNLPDLTEEQSSSLDESTRRDDICTEVLAAENLNYLNCLLSLTQEDVEDLGLELEGEASGEGCEHLHLVMKYWKFIVQPYPELRQAVSWSRARCHCTNCHPDAPVTLAGWVRIERVEGASALTRAFWHVARSTLGSAQACDAGPMRRPRCLISAPPSNPPFDDIWFDEEGKPHNTVLVVEIYMDRSNIDNDRLLAFLIHMKPHVVYSDDTPLSMDD